MKTACILHSFLPRYRSSRRGALPVDPQRGGLTVLELMIVVSVIAVVAAIAIPSLAHAKKVGNEASAFSALRSISTVNTRYRTRFGVFSDSLADLEAAGYLGFNEATPQGGLLVSLRPRRERLGVQRFPDHFRPRGRPILLYR